MKRIRRRLFNSAATVSLALLILVLLVWARSYYTTFGANHRTLVQPDGTTAADDSFNWDTRTVRIIEYHFTSSAGRLLLQRLNYDFDSPVFSGTREYRPSAKRIFRFDCSFSPGLASGIILTLEDQDIRDSGGLVGLGFGFSNESGQSPIPGGTNRGMNAWSRRKLMLPDWFVALLFAILPAIWLYRWRRSRRFAAHLCQTCGYDLRATPERCPECGTVKGGDSRFAHRAD